VQGNPALPQGIEGVKMRNKHYNLMAKLVIAIPCLAAIFFVPARLAVPQQAGAGQQSTLKTSSLESHEGLTISARPWTQAAQYKEKFPKKSPFTGGVLAVQVAFRNDSDQSMKVGLDHIRLSFNIDEDNRQELQPLQAAEVADAILHPGAKDPTQRRRLPIPLATTGGNKSKEFTELQTQVQNAAVPTSVVAAHSTVQGLLYFGMQGQFDLLSTAHLYIPDVAIMGKPEGITYFEIDLSH
jgi:hypothetical protein